MTLSLVSQVLPVPSFPGAEATLFCLGQGLDPRSPHGLCLPLQGPLGLSSHRRPRLSKEKHELTLNNDY